MSYSEANIATWIASDYYRELKRHKINYLEGTSTTGLIPIRTTEYVHTCLRAVTGAADKPTRFMAVMLTFSISDNVDEALREWYVGPIDETGDGYCICSKNIHYEYYIINNINKNVLLVGCDCVSKVQFPGNIKEQIKGQVKIKSALDKNKKYKRCERCQYRIIPEESNDKYCRGCITAIRYEEMLRIEEYRRSQEEIRVKEELRRRCIEQARREEYRRSQEEIRAKEELRKRCIEQARREEYLRNLTLYPERNNVVTNEEQARNYAKEHDISPEYQEKLNRYLEDRKKPREERIYI